MTVIETLYSLRQLLDDTRDWYFPNILWGINQAQSTMIHKLYAQQDEVGLAPLYKFDKKLQSGDYIGETDLVTGNKVALQRKVLYPRSCYLYILDTLAGNTELYYPESLTRAVYVDLDEFVSWPAGTNIPYDPTINVSTDFPKRAVYTLETIASDSNLTRILFNQVAPNMYAMLFYIYEPPAFDIQIQDDQVIYTYPLSLPPLYHAEVVGLAAEILNNQDVSEIERGDFFNVYTGDRKLTLQQVLSLNFPKA